MTAMTPVRRKESDAMWYSLIDWKVHHKQLFWGLPDECKEDGENAWPTKDLTLAYKLAKQYDTPTPQISYINHLTTFHSIARRKDISYSSLSSSYKPADSLTPNSPPNQHIWLVNP